MSILKSIGAVFAGLVFIFVTHSGVDLALESLGIFTPPNERFDTPWMVVTATIYRTVLSIAGCFLTGVLAPSRPMLHSLILGFIGLFLSTAAAVVTIPMDLGPAWYPIALAVLSVPCAWVGGKLAELRTVKLS
ncbi:MAG TPA: hypothetical protein VFZ23_04850 [Pyrinomonadaceae bacterium]